MSFQQLEKPFSLNEILARDAVKAEQLHKDLETTVFAKEKMWLLCRRRTPCPRSLPGQPA